MLAACETGEVFALLEARDALDAFVSLFANVRDSSLIRALLLYHARTGSERALELMARAPDPHARYLLDALCEQLRAERSQRAHALAALAPIVARRPSWLHRLAGHPLARELLRAARQERDPLPLLHALLTLAVLHPAEPAFAAQYWPDLADAALRPTAIEPPPRAPARDHLRLAQLALFHALYATHPCTLLETLRAECASLTARDDWERALVPLLSSVRLHPALVTGSKQREADAARWARLELHDVVAESRRLSFQARERHDDRPPPPAPAVTPAPLAPPSPAPGSGAYAARAASGLRPGTEPWFALGDRCGAESAPNTPLPAEAEVAEPPEAAVEATPENTPAKETRTQFRFPTESPAVRAIGRRSQPPSPLRKETSPPAAMGAPGGGDAYAGRLARVAQERRAVESPVPFAGAPPPASAAVARPEPSRGAPALDVEPLNVEDREVLELTARARVDDGWQEETTGPPRVMDPRRGRGGGGRRGGQWASTGRNAAPARRAASCSARLPPARTCSVAVQTLETWPASYEFIIADFYRGLPDDVQKQIFNTPLIEDKKYDYILSSDRLDKYLSELYTGKRGSGGGAGEAAELAEQLALVHAQLMYERWRREAHAERNRRLLGRCRTARGLELQNAALAERLRATTRERDELRARLARSPPPAPTPPAPSDDRERRLEAALAEESAARLRAEAALRELEAQRALDAAELQRARGESFEAARHAESLARAALAAERRAEHVRRLRRELLVLAEREARLSGEVRAAAAAGAGAEAAAGRAAGEERTLRAALVRAEAEAEASSARAEAAAARAHELEAALAARDAAAAELRRGARLAAEEHAARTKALRDKYAALLRVVRTAEARRLERRAGTGVAAGAGGPRTPVGGAGGPLAARPALADCSRVRRLLDRDEDEAPLERS